MCDEQRWHGNEVGPNLYHNSQVEDFCYEEWRLKTKIWDVW